MKNHSQAQRDGIDRRMGNDRVSLPWLRPALMALSLALTPIQHTTADEVLFADDFEDDAPTVLYPYPGLGERWTACSNDRLARGGAWQIGACTNPKGPTPKAHGGRRIAATGLTGNPASQDESWLLSPLFYLPYFGAENTGAALRFWQHRDLGSHMAEVLVGQVAEGFTYPLWHRADISLAPYSGRSDGWQYCGADLTPWKGGWVVIAFKQTGVGGRPGWFIDDVVLKLYDLKWLEHIGPWNGQTESFENGWKLWTTDKGGWDVGKAKRAAGAPTKAAAGASWAGTGMRGHRPVVQDCSLISPPIFIRKKAGQKFVLEFSYWCDYADGGGTVEWSQHVLSAGSNTWSWTGFDSIWPRKYQKVFTGRTRGWRQARIDLSPIVGLNITGNTNPFRLAFHSLGRGGMGWFIDNVRIRAVAATAKSEDLEIDEIQVQHPQGTDLIPGLAKKSFGTVPIGRTGSQASFAITNTGTTEWTGLKAAIAGRHPQEFVITAAPPDHLGPGEQTSLKLAFHPNARGTRDALLTIRRDDGSPFTVRLAGQAVERAE